MNILKENQSFKFIHIYDIVETNINKNVNHEYNYFFYLLLIYWIKNKK